MGAWSGLQPPTNPNTICSTTSNTFHNTNPCTGQNHRCEESWAAKAFFNEKKGGKKADKGIIPYDDNMEISVPHHPTDPPSSNPNTLATLVPFSPVSQSSPSMSLPAAINPPSAPPTDMLPITYSPSPTATYPHLPNAIHHIPAPPTNLPALTYSPSLPTTSQRKKKK